MTFFLHFKFFAPSLAKAFCIEHSKIFVTHRWPKHTPHELMAIVFEEREPSVPFWSAEIYPIASNSLPCDIHRIWWHRRIPGRTIQPIVSSVNCTLGWCLANLLRWSTTDTYWKWHLLVCNHSSLNRFDRIWAGIFFSKNALNSEFGLSICFVLPYSMAKRIYRVHQHPPNLVLHRISGHSIPKPKSLVCVLFGNFHKLHQQPFGLCQHPHRRLICVRERQKQKWFTKIN